MAGGFLGDEDKSGVMTHRVRGRLRPSAVLRDFVHVGSVQVVYSTLNAVATLGSVAGYIQGTFYEQKGKEMSLIEERIQNLLLCWFAFIFAFEHYIAYDRVEHMKKLVTICDFLSVLPIITWVFSSMGLKGDALDFLSIFRASPRGVRPRPIFFLGRTGGHAR